jgi:protein-S-isoprenylcysteine O-methyltransferase Ste14
MNLLKSVLHNIGVLAVGFTVGRIGAGIDSLFGIPRLASPLMTIVGTFAIAAGFLLRVWATFHFYERQMMVISLAPQRSLITTGPYRFSRNRLYWAATCSSFLALIW